MTKLYRKQVENDPKQLKLLPSTYILPGKSTAVTHLGTTGFNPIIQPPNNVTNNNYTTYNESMINLAGSSVHGGNFVTGDMTTNTNSNNSVKYENGGSGVIKNLKKLKKRLRAKDSLMHDFFGKEIACSIKDGETVDKFVE